MHDITGDRRDRPRFAGEEGRVDGGAAVDDGTVGREALAGADAHRHPGEECRCRHGALAAILGHHAGRIGRQRVEQLGGIGRGALAALLQEATGEQGKDQDGDAVEIDRAAIRHRVDRPTHKARAERQSDRQVHVEPTRAERGNRTGEEDASWKEHRRNRQPKGDPAEESLVRRVHPGEFSGVECQRGEHHVASNRPGDADARQHGAVLTTAHRVTRDATERMRRVAELVQCARHPGERQLLRVPFDPRQCPPHIQLRAHDAREEERYPLDQPDTGGAMDAFQIELGDGAPVCGRLHIQLGERGVVELLERVATALHRRLAPLAEGVVLPQAALLHDAVRSLAAAATERRGATARQQGGRDGQAAMRAGRAELRGDHGAVSGGAPQVRLTRSARQQPPAPRASPGATSALRGRDRDATPVRACRGAGWWRHSPSAGVHARSR